MIISHAESAPDPQLPRPVVVLGPTAGGKSDLAVEIAERVPGGGEVISADSMQVYRHMDAGTAKPEPALRARVPHHLVDVVEPTGRFTVYDWLGRVEPLIEGLQRQGKRPVVVGGTNLYLKALLEGMFDAPGARGQDAAFRASLEGVPEPELHARLRAVDPVAAERIAVADRKRITRALEVHHLTGRPISELQAQWRDRPAAEYRFNPILIGLDWPREAINPRINARVKQMFHPEAGEPPAAESLPDETRRLEAAGLLGPQAREALGYKQVLQALRGEISMDDAMEQTKIQTRRFAKQQRTWLRRFRGIHWLEPVGKTAAALGEEAMGAVQEAGE